MTAQGRSGGARSSPRLCAVPRLAYVYFERSRAVARLHASSPATRPGASPPTSPSCRSAAELNAARGPVEKSPVARNRAKKNTCEWRRVLFDLYILTREKDRTKMLPQLRELVAALASSVLHISSVGRRLELWAVVDKSKTTTDAGILPGARRESGRPA
jgi:hypothetical protein